MGDNKPRVEKILELFIKCGVMTESPGPKYLIVKPPNNWKGIPKSQGVSHIQGLETIASSTYCEVNDAQLLSQLAKEISTKSEPILTTRKDAFIRPILANNHTIEIPGTNLKKWKASFVDIKMPENHMQTFAEWICGEGPYLRTGIFPDNQPKYLESSALGEFECASDALENIGYTFPEVNRKYECLHKHR